MLGNFCLRSTNHEQRVNKKETLPTTCQ